MKNVILFLLIVILTGCCSNKYISTDNQDDEYAGVWLSQNNEGAILKINLIENHVYNLNFVSSENQWEGIGYQIGMQMLAIFNYKNLDQKGYVTFTHVNSGKINYKSMNSDGSFRVSGSYIKK